MPLDNYLADLNSGQSWYRPSYLVVAVLRNAHAPALVQSALNRVYNQFYRHQLTYYHPSENCTSISVDALRAIGWPIPVRGPSSRLLAWIGFPFLALKERSIGKAKLAFDYLYTDQTRLLPAAALEEAFGSLWALAHGAPGSDTRGLAALLAQDLEALAFVRTPQFPSSRAFGDAPAVTTGEYHARIPNDPALAQRPGAAASVPEECAIRIVAASARPPTTRRRSGVVDHRHSVCLWCAWRRRVRMGASRTTAGRAVRATPYPDPATINVPTPPAITAPTGPSHSATVPALNSPSSLLAPMKVPLTALTRPRIASGVSSWTSVWRITTLTMSAPPLTASATIDNMKSCDSPNTMIAIP